MSNDPADANPPRTGVPPYRVDRLVFAAGSRPSAPPLEIEVRSVTVLVGPHNSGKSTTLSEIEAYSRGGALPGKVLAEVGMDFPRDPAGLEALLRRFQRPQFGRDQQELEDRLRSLGVDPDRYFEVAHLDIKDLRGVVHRFDMDTFSGWLTNPDTNLRTLLGIAYTLRLDGRTRFQFVEPQPTGDLREAPGNHLWYLATNDGARDRVRAITAEALGRHFVLDATAMQHFRIRLSERPPKSREEELGLGRAALDFHARAPEIRDFGDGVQAFVGIISAAVGLPATVLLVDEPEAFLAPSLARAAGRALARVAHERGGSLIAATHSAEFLTGCLEVVPESTVVRLARDGGISVARTVNAVKVSAMMRDPLLRSAGVLQALFHPVAVVTEAAGDRAFYEEVNRRLTDVGRGLKDALFLSGQSLQIIRRSVAPLRQFGVPAAAIVDLDVLAESETNWARLLDACHVDADQRADLQRARQELVVALDGTSPRSDGTPAIKNGGIQLLPPDAQAQARWLLDELAGYGLFVVPSGELESWLPHLEIRGPKSTWVDQVFGHIGQSEGDPNYVAASEGDIWGFLDDVAHWAADPRRRGLD
jgi:predicted ATPase